MAQIDLLPTASKLSLDGKLPYNKKYLDNANGLGEVLTMNQQPKENEMVAPKNRIEAFAQEVERLEMEKAGLLQVLGELLDSLNENGTRDEFTNTAVAASKAEVLIASIK